MRVSHLPIGCAPRLTKGLSTYDRIVDHYIREVRDRARDENRWFAIQRTLSDAVEVAAMARSRSGKRLHHQRRIPTPTLRAFADRLKRVAARLRKAKSFEQLHDVIVGEARDLHGIGSLTAYDAALRIGAFLKLEPDRIYLHTGTREGAKVFGLGDREWITASELPASFRRLHASEIEDVLCIYRDELAAIRRKEFAQSKSRS